MKWEAIMGWLFGGLLAALTFAVTGFVGTTQAVNHVYIPSEVALLYTIVFAFSGFGVFFFGVMFTQHTVRLSNKHKEQQRKEAALQRAKKHKSMERREKQRVESVQMLKATFKLWSEYKLADLADSRKFDHGMILKAMDFLTKGDYLQKHMGLMYVLSYRNRNLTEMMTRHTEFWIREIAKEELAKLEPSFLAAT